MFVVRQLVSLGRVNHVVTMSANGSNMLVSPHRARGTYLTHWNLFSTLLLGPHTFQVYETEITPIGCLRERSQ
jgi:uncharacterized protein YodC (DUF2158 family)